MAELRIYGRQMARIFTGAIGNPIDLASNRDNRVQLQFRPEWLLQKTDAGVELAPLLLGEVRSKAAETLGK